MARHGARQVAVAALAIIGGVGVGAQNSQPAPTFRSERVPSLDRALVHRMREYLQDNARHLPATIATEKYEQRAGWYAVQVKADGTRSAWPPA